MANNINYTIINIFTKCKIPVKTKIGFDEGYEYLFELDQWPVHMFLMKHPILLYTWANHSFFP